MLRVKNKQTIRHIAWKSFLANQIRNLMGILAVILTTLLFCALFTTIISMNYSMEQQTMRQVGGYAHGGFKELSKEQEEQLKVHPLVKEYGTTRILTILENELFDRDTVEVRCAYGAGAKMFFCDPTKGRMPEKETEMATDTQVLDLLGVPHEIGAQVTVPFFFQGEKVEKTFTLCGYWERDPIALVSQMWVSESFLEQTLDQYPSDGNEGYEAGAWNLDLYFSDSSHIRENLQKIAEDNGYQIQDPESEDYLRTGVNWAYTKTHVNSGEEILNLAAAILLLLMIVLTGYLIIYNIFQISVAGDIRFFGLLKTIGTTGRQIKRLLRYQALCICVLGIPIGLALGYFIGNGVTQAIMKTMSEKQTYLTLNPWIFIGSALFSIFTVLISLRKPGRMAASVSPVEAVRYVDAADSSLKKRKTHRRRGPKVWQMAMASLGRNRKKSVLVILSLSLSVVLFHSTCSLVSGLDMDKFVKKFVISDYLIAHEDYFKSSFGAAKQEVSETLIESINMQEGVKESGQIYRDTGIVQLPSITKKQYIQTLADMQLQYLDDNIRNMSDDDTLDVPIGMYGLDQFPYENLKIIEGSDKWEEFDTAHSIIQLVKEDDYGNPELRYAPFAVGDEISILFVDDYEYSGEDYDAELTIHSSHIETYKIIATAIIPTALSVRRFGGLEFALSPRNLKEEIGDDCSVMSYMLNVEEEADTQIHDFLTSYTENIEPDFQFESKEAYTSQFDTFRQMFLVIGGAASIVVALVGILNFINTIITGIRSRRRELAMLQSIGMTGRQLRQMLCLEGCAYGIYAILLSLGLNLLIYSVLLKQLENLLWLFSAQFILYPTLSMLPIFLLLGILIPILAYQNVEKQSVVERLREVE